MKINKTSFKTFIPFLIALFTFGLTIFFKNNPSITEYLYSNGFYPKIASFLSFTSSIFPFSLDDLLYISLIILILLGIIFTILKKIKWYKLILYLFQTFAIVFSSFYWLWGFNYFREDAHKRLNLNKSEPNTEVFIEVFDDIITNINKNYCNKTNFDNLNYNQYLEDSYKNLSEFLKFKYPSGNRRIKYITFSNFFAKATILGYYGPFFSETHINKHLTVWDIPVVLGHEKSHQLGITSEAEAGFYGFLVCAKSNDKFLRYTGWMYALNYFLSQSKDLEERKILINKLKPEIIKDLKERENHWQNLRNPKIDKVANKVNDAYLKTNSVKKGINDYNDIVQLIIDYYFHNNKNISND